MILPNSVNGSVISLLREGLKFRENKNPRENFRIYSMKICYYTCVHSARMSLFYYIWLFLKYSFSNFS